MDNKEVISTLSDIKNMMEKSSKFLALSGVSAIIVGIYAFIGAYAAYCLLENPLNGFNLLGLPVDSLSRLQSIVLLAIILLTVSLVTAFLFSWYKAKKANRMLTLDQTAVRLLWNFFLPLLTGGILCISLLSQQHYGLTSSVMLIFYGMALINSSKYTYSNTRYLGYAELILGLTDSFIQGYGLLFWTIGFGLFHIIYGILFYLKYDRQKA